MARVIAITGKGGAGKTTLAALLVDRLIAAGQGPVLAVDADPNSCLDAALGVKAENTLGRVREEARAIAGKGMATGIAKQQLLEMKISECLVEAEGFDLIAMGRPEGQGCYCYANNVLKEVLAALAGNYPLAVIDNEAGLENLSRRIVCEADLLLFVTEPTPQGFATVRRLQALAKEMNIAWRHSAIAVNRLLGDMPSTAEMLAADLRVDYLVGLPLDDTVTERVSRGLSLRGLSDDKPLVKAVDKIVAMIFPANATAATASGSRLTIAPRNLG